METAYQPISGSVRCGPTPAMGRASRCRALHTTTRKRRRIAHEIAAASWPPELAPVLHSESSDLASRKPVAGFGLRVTSTSMDVVAAWLLTQAIGPDGYSRLVSRLRNPSEFRRLRKAVRNETGIRPGRGYHRWWSQDDTWDNLLARSNEAYDRLVDRLAEEETKRIFRNRQINRDRAVKLVEATLAHFLPVLDPSMATAVADARNEERYKETISRLDASSSFQDRLELIPPNARRVLDNEHVPGGPAERLVDAVVSGDPRTVISGFVALPPKWLVEAPAPIILALAELAQSYRLHDEAAQLYEQVAELGVDRARHYAKAAFEYAVAGQPQRSDGLISSARAVGSDPYIDVIEGGLNEDWTKIIGAVDRDVATGDPFLVQIYALALRNQGDLDASIIALSEANERLLDYPGVALQLARMLLDRSIRVGTTSRARDLSSALHWAEHARDLRRKWRGDSSEAVTIACHAALAARDYQRVIQLGTSEPDGVARVEEEDVPETRFIVAQAAIAGGFHDLARRAATSVSGFRQALILGDLMATSGASRAEIDEQFTQTWELAETERDRVDFWISAAMAGMESIPGQKELDLRTDDLPLLVRASQHISHGRPAAAIDLLRPLRQSEAARGFLTDAYLARGDIDDAVAELVEMADRFTNPQHLIHAVKILAGANRLPDAAELADRTLRLVSPNHPERDFIHGIGLAAAEDRGDWHDMETRARAWITESGPAPRRRWRLVQALLNQSRSGAAWRISQEEGDTEPTTSAEARMWIALHAEHSPSPETFSKALALCDRFPEDPDVRRSAVNAFLLANLNDDDVSEEELARWRLLVDERARNPAPDDTFISIRVPDDPQELIEALRPYLEPQAQRMEEWRSKVRKGWPYGMLAVAAGRPYTMALAQRAAGFLPIASPHPDVIKAERGAAAETLDKPVVADLSVLTTAWYIRERWPQMLGSFTRVELTPESKRDAADAASSMQAPSSGTLGWDVNLGRPVLQDSDPKQQGQLETHVRWINEAASSLSLRSYPSGSEIAQNAERLGAWMTSVEAAKAAGLPLWADDVGLRTLARNEGIISFGTTALLQALESRGRLSWSDQASSLETLRNQFCVDLPLDGSWLIAASERDNWQPGPALLIFARPSTWSDLPRGFEIWREIVANAGNSDPANVPPWVHAASTGLIDAVNAQTAMALVANVVVVAAGAAKGDPAAFAASLSAAKAAADAEGIPAPTELVLRKIFELFSNGAKPADAAVAVARIGDQLSEEDRQIMREVIFGI